MIALRQIQTVQSNTVTVSLPKAFHAKRVEIIILPLEEPAGPTANLLELLLAAPTLSDEELQNFEDMRAWMNQWNEKDF